MRICKKYSSSDLKNIVVALSYNLGAPILVFPRVLIRLPCNGAQPGAHLMYVNSARAGTVYPTC